MPKHSEFGATSRLSRLLAWLGLLAQLGLLARLTHLTEQLSGSSLVRAG